MSIDIMLSVWQACCAQDAYWRARQQWYDQSWFTQRHADLKQAVELAWDEAERVSLESGVAFKNRRGEWSEPPQELVPTNLLGMALQAYRLAVREGTVRPMHAGVRVPRY